jgi:hypothetical protein
MQDAHAKLHPGLPRQKQHSTRRRNFHQDTEIKFKEESGEILHLERSLTGEVLHLERSFVWCFKCDVAVVLRTWSTWWIGESEHN